MALLLLLLLLLLPPPPLPPPPIRTTASKVAPHVHARSPGLAHAPVGQGVHRAAVAEAAPGVLTALGGHAEAADGETGVAGAAADRHRS